MSEQMEKCVYGSSVRVCAICILQSDSSFSAAMCYFVFKWKRKAEIEVMDAMSEKLSERSRQIKGMNKKSVRVCVRVCLCHPALIN